MISDTDLEFNNWLENVFSRLSPARSFFSLHQMKVPLFPRLEDENPGAFLSALGATLIYASQSSEKHEPPPPLLSLSPSSPSAIHWFEQLSGSRVWKRAG